MLLKHVKELCLESIMHRKLRGLSPRAIYRPSDRCLSAKLMPAFENRRCHVVSVTDPYGRILGFLDRSRYFSIK
jgi:hypothetical protein